jgi:hypothetical protein
MLRSVGHVSSTPSASSRDLQQSREQGRHVDRDPGAERGEPEIEPLDRHHLAAVGHHPVTQERPHDRDRVTQAGGGLHEGDPVLRLDLHAVARSQTEDEPSGR